MGRITWKYSMVTNRKSRNFDVENKQINKWKNEQKKTDLTHLI